MAPTDTAQRAHLRRIGWAALCLSAAIGALTLAGWLSSEPQWVAPIPGLMPMHPRSALCLLMCCVALGLLMPRERPRWTALLSHVLALGVLAMATSSLLKRFSLIDWTLGGHLFERFGARSGTAPVGASFCYILLACALLLLNHTPRRVRAAQLLTIVAFSISAIALAGYAYDAAALAGPGAIGPTRGMTFYTSIAVGIFSLAVMCARSEYGVMAIISSRRSGGAFARRMFAGTLIVPALGATVVVCERAGLLDQRLGHAVLAVVAMMLLVGVTLLNARSMNRIDAARARALERSRQAYEREWLQRTWLQLVLEQIPDGIILLDERGRVSAINRAARALMCGPTGRKDAYGNEIMFDVRDKLGQPLRDEDMPMVRALREGVELKETELMLRVQDGRHVPVFVSAVPVRRQDGKIAGAVTVAQDITARKELDRLREEWSSLVAHDLRQPATVISFASQLLPRLHEGALNDGETRALERIQTASHRLKRMIEDLLDFSRIEAQRLSVDRQPVDLCTITRSIVERTHELTGVPIALGCDQEGFISGDPVRVEQVLGNLLSNAIKYGNPGAEIHVEVRNQPQMVLLSVKNHGPGISEDELPRLFSRFTRTASAASGQIEGLGLGLYISKGIVEAHGGRIWAESAPGHTTTFHVLWPSLKAASHAGPKDVDEPTHVH